MMQQGIQFIIESSVTNEHMLRMYFQDWDEWSVVCWGNTALQSSDVDREGSVHRKEKKTFIGQKPKREKKCTCTKRLT